MNSRINASLHNQNGFAWVAGLMLVGAIALTGVFAQTVFAAITPTTPSTNDINRTNGWAHVDQLSQGVGTTDLQFINPRAFWSCFEYRADNEANTVAGANPNPAITDGRWTQVCVNNSQSTKTILANGFVDVRMVYGAETDERFDWTRFEVDPAPSTGSIEITKYLCPDGTAVTRAANGVGGTVPAGCTLQAGETFGYVHGTQTDAGAPYPELDGPFIEGGVTDASGELVIGKLPADGRYLVFETDGAGNKLPSEEILGLYCIGDGDTSGTNDNQELTFVPAGQSVACVAYNEADAPTEDLVTIRTQKIVCDEESDLPNWGAGTSTLNGVTSNTANRWLNANQGNGCHLADWNFQWVDNAVEGGNSNPGDQTEIAPSPWSTPFINSVTFDASNMNRVWLREVFDTDYIPFTGANTTENVSAEMYCGPDILNYDNWEYIDKPQDGWADDYYCVAFNVSLEPVEPPFCEGNLLTNGGFEENVVTDPALWQLFASIPGWMVDWMNPSQDTPMFELQAGVNSWLAFEGNQYIELDSDRPDTNANTKVWQNIPTIAGKTYELSYQFSARPGTGSADNTVEVYWDGGLEQTISDDGTGDVVNVWLPQTIFGLSATTTSTSLEFRATGTSNELGGFIDAVCLVEVPEKACRLEVVSLEEDEGVGNGDAVEAWNHPSWATDLNAFAEWIWDTQEVQNPEIDEAKTFAKSFFVTGPVNDATLTFAADNRYWIEINGDDVASSTAEFNYGATQSLDVTSFIDEDTVNTIVMKIENIGLAGYEERPHDNPAAGIYQLIINAEEEMCRPVDVPECSDGIDNDGDGFTDYNDGEGDPGCDSDDDDDEYNEPDDVVEYGPYCGDGFVDETWEQCDPGLISRDSISIDNGGSCNQYCQLDNQCSDLVVARINTNSLTNTGEEYGADMTGDVWIGGDEEGTHNIPGWAWFPVYLNGSAIDDLDLGNYDNVEDVPGYAVNRDEDMIRVRMHGDHSSEVLIREHAEGSIEIVHAYTDTPVLTAMKNQLAGNAMEFPFNGTVGSVTNPRNDELNLGGLGNFWMVVGPEDDGFRAEYSTENLPSCEGNVTICKENGYGTALNGWQVMLLGDLADEVTVNPDGNDYVSDNLPADYYVVLANGEYVYRGTAGAENSDAAYSERDPSDSVYAGPFVPWVRENDFPVPNQGWLGIIMNNSFTDWGNIFNPAHQYALGVNTSGVQSFKILDDQYGDNSGSIDMDIYEGWVGITGGGQEEEAGCYTFHDVPVGEYTVAEIMQDGWSHDSETEDDLGPVTVDGDETFTIVNDEDGQECNPDLDDCDGEGDDDGTVIGHKWNDLNNDGEWNNDEPGLAGWTIELKGENVVLASDVTDVNGEYSITFSDGGYTLCEVQQGGWTQTFPVGNGGCHAIDILADSTIGDYNFGNHQNPQIIDEEPNNNTSRSNSRRSGGGGSDGRVLGATTEGFCPFLKDYLHINMQNNPTEVNKAKAFFNSYLGKALILDGVFDQSLFAAAVEFQNMFSGDVLDTWVEEFAFLDNDATGYIYQTTKWKINSILCPGYEAFPDQLIVANGTTVAY